MKCKKYIDKIIENGGLDFADKNLINHLSKCKTCKQELDDYNFLFEQLHGCAPYKSTISVDKIMKAIDTKENVEIEQTSFLPWLLSVIITLVGVALISPMATELAILNSSDSFLQGLYIIIGLLLSAFIACFCYTHLPLLKKFNLFINKKVEKIINYRF